MRHSQILLATFLMAILTSGIAAAVDNCAICHEDPKFKIKHRTLFEYTVAFQSSSHGEAGLECVDCHGGNASAEDLDAVHQGVMDPVRYAQIPTTCGECHEDQHDAFVTSNHSQSLKNDETGPNCVTCHGAMDMSLIAVVDVKETCQECHAEGADIDTEVPARAEHILTLINNIKGYRNFVAKHGDDQLFIANTERAYEHLTSAWHRFDLDGVSKDAETLLADLRHEKNRIIAQRRKH